jgi:DNA-binding transcriptional regulator/RsmH inhibitor MraZ
MTKLIVAFRSYTKASKICLLDCQENSIPLWNKKKWYQQQATKELCPEIDKYAY